MSAPPTIAVIAPGEMGAAIGRRLASAGARIVTRLEGRSGASRRRAEAAGMADVDQDGIARADMILSIVPPRDALALAEQLAPALAAAITKPLYVDCNAVSPATVLKVAERIEGAGCPFADAGIIGNPPTPEGYTPAIYTSGPEAPRFAALNALGLDIRVMDGPVGQASALKMCYAGLTKGLHAVGVSVLLGAIEAGIGGPFLEEMAASQPQLLAYFRQRSPGIFPKAYRWVAEMEEIGAFLGGGAATLYDGAARQFERLAQDRDGDRSDETTLLQILRRPDGV